jgi:ankyrin repeat protein
LLLLDARSIDINGCDKSQLTPLHVAGIQGDAELCTMLMDRGADYKAQAIDKTTPLHVAVANGNRLAANVILKKGRKLCFVQYIKWMDGWMDEWVDG